MAPSTAKRRKISPTASVPGSVAPTTPSRIPVPRPSFASPTKASIAKHNPQLLEKQAGAAASEDARPPSRNNAPQPPPTESLFVTQSSTIDTEAVSEVQNSLGRPDVEGEQLLATPSIEEPATKARATRSARGGFTEPPRRMSRTPGREIAPSSTDFAGTTMDPDAQINPFRQAGLRRSPVMTRQQEPDEPVVSPPAQLSTRNPEQEPDLPPTPVQLGIRDPVVTTPPSGIHDTPSKRSKRRKVTKIKTSPLKRRSEIPAKMANIVPDILPTEDTEKPMDQPENTQYPSRLLPPIDPHSEKKSLRDQLLLEVQQLRADVLIAEKESERLRSFHASGEIIAAEPSHYDDVLKLLLRSTAGQASTANTKKAPSVFDNINSFLPFTTRRRPLPEPKTVDSQLPVSHNPLLQSDALPYLQLFTPLVFTSSIALLPPTPPNSGEVPSVRAPLLQSHTVTASLPSGLFSARLNMVVNTKTLAINSLNLEKVDPSAQAELGRWIQRRASSDNLLGRDVNAVFCAMRQWVELATERAKFWCEVEREMGTVEKRTNVALAAKAKGTRKRKRKDGGEDTGQDIGGNDSGDELANEKVSKWKRKQLLPQMKRTSMTLIGDNVELLVEWVIGFDWTGEAESRISASARIPSSWREEDERGSFAKVPETFQRIMRNRGPKEGVKAMVALLMPA